MNLSTTNRGNYLSRFLLVCIAIATVLNGANFWLTKAGFINQDRHQQLVQDRNLAYEKLLSNYREQRVQNPTQAKQYLDEKRDQLNLSFSNKITQFYRSSPGLLSINKALKYLVIVGLFVYCLSMIYQGKANLNSSKSLIVLLVYLSLMALITWKNHGLIAVLPGASIYSFAIIAFIGIPLVQPGRYDFLIKTLAITCLIFAVLVPIELIRHVQLFSSNWQDYRISGFMNLPNTMGIYLLCIYSLVSNFYLNANRIVNLNLILFSIFILLGIILTGSYTASITFFVFLTIVHYRDLVKKPTTLFGFVCLIVISFTLLSLKSDHIRLLSLSGRLYKFGYYLQHEPQLVEILFGQGIGFSSNLLINLSNYFQVDASSLLFAADSTPLALLMQIGIIGIVLVYGLIIYAAILDKSLRPVYLVFLICTLTINFFEIFPLNIILGIMLAKSLADKQLENDTSLAI